MSKIIIIDDDTEMCRMMTRQLGSLSHQVTCAHSIKTGMEMLNSDRYHLLLLDVRLPDGSGIEIIPQIKELDFSPEVIVLTADADSGSAELCIRYGAWDYLQKPYQLDQMKLAIKRACDYQAQKYEKQSLQLRPGYIIGNSKELNMALEQVNKAARTNASVLIVGETGTGKELFARAIHENSDRSHANLVVVDCSVLPENLVESILFGHIKGAFTGAGISKSGLIEQSDGGTLFLDEVGELPLKMQKNFLRLIQEKRFRPIGGKKEFEINFRLVAATNRDLTGMVLNGNFRQDLLHRLNSFIIKLPSLRDRKSDIPILCDHFSKLFSKRYQVSKKIFSKQILNTFTAYTWPGNVRELMNVIDQLFIMFRNEAELFPEHLPLDFRALSTRDSFVKKQLKTNGHEDIDFLDGHELMPTIDKVRKMALEKVENQYLKRLMKITENDINQACRISGIAKSRMYMLLKKYHIPKT